MPTRRVEAAAPGLRPRAQPPESRPRWISPATGWQRGGTPSWQGESTATWDLTGRGAGEGAGTLVVRTSTLRPGYLRKNGVPYSASTTMTEYWDLITERTGEQRLLILLVVEDPLYLQQPWVVPVHFKKEPNGGKWDPIPCNARF